MFHSAAARATTWSTKAKETMQRHAHNDDGLESIEVVVLSVVGLGIVIALGVAIKALVEHYQGKLTAS